MTREEKGKEKKKGFFDRMFEWQAKPLKILTKEVTEGIKEGAYDEGKSTEDATAVLKLRLAKGEITKEQYEELKRAIENK